MGPMILTLQPCFRLALIALALVISAVPTAAQDYATQKPRRQFVTISLDWLNTEALHFASYPLEDRFLTIPLRLRGTLSF